MVPSVERIAEREVGREGVVDDGVDDHGLDDDACERPRLPLTG